MTEGQKAFKILSNLGAPVQTSVWSGVEFKLDLEQGLKERLGGISDTFWIISPARRDRLARRLRRKGWSYGLNPKLARILKNHNLTASWQSTSVLNVYVNREA